MAFLVERKKIWNTSDGSLNPKISVLDETDSGLDVDALKIVSDGVNNLKDKKNAVVVITHYQRLLDYIKPDIVHIMSDGKIIKSGDADSSFVRRKNGYSEILNEKARNDQFFSNLEKFVNKVYPNQPQRQPIWI